MASSNRQYHDSSERAELRTASALNFRMNPLSNYRRIFNYDPIERKTPLTYQVNGSPRPRRRRNANAHRLLTSFYHRKKEPRLFAIIILFALAFIFFTLNLSHVYNVRNFPFSFLNAAFKPSMYMDLIENVALIFHKLRTICHATVRNI